MADPQSAVQVIQVNTYARIIRVKLDADTGYVIDLLVGDAGQPDAVCLPRAGTRRSLPRQLKRCIDNGLLVPFTFTQDQNGRRVDLGVERFADGVDHVLDALEDGLSSAQLARSNAETAVMFARRAAGTPFSVARVGADALQVHLIRRLLG